MIVYEFKVEEVMRNDFIDWDVVELHPTTHRFPAHNPMKAGSYPEVEHHLQSTHSFVPSPPLVYLPDLGDDFDQSEQTWTFTRNGHKIIVRDMPRTILRVGMQRP